MSDIRLLSLTDTERLHSWVELCGSADLFASHKWLAVERAECGPWIPTASGCLARMENQQLTAGVTLQKFDSSVDDVIIRVDKMLHSHPAWNELPGEQMADALLPSLMCGGWFNSRILEARTLSAGQGSAARREMIAEIVAVARKWGCASISFPYLDARNTELRADLRQADFSEIPGPNRHVFHSDYSSYAEYFGSQLRAKRRAAIKNELKKFNQPGVRTSHDPLDDSNVERIAELAHRLELKHDQVSTYEQIASWFSAIARNTRTTVFTAALEGRVFGMSMWVHHQDSMYSFHAGFDYDISRRLPAYSVVVYRLPIAFACSDRQTKYLEYGVGGDQAKLSRGCQAVPGVLCVKPLSPTAEAVVARLQTVPASDAGAVGDWV